MRTRDARRTARRATLVVAAALGLGLLAQGAASAQEEGQGNAAPKVTICHATGSESNPYVQQTVSANAIWNGGTANGHGTHDGPVFEPGMTEAWGDIIPPFEYEVMRGGETVDEPFPGMNWPEGQAIFDAGCVLPEPVEPDEPADLCPNLEGVQAEVPEGFELVDGECVAVVVEPTDVCPNLEGVQAEVPEGFELVDGECVAVVVEPTDVCPNLEGVQAEVPEGFELVDGECVAVVVEPTDVCPNLEGVQAEVPEGFELVDGDCVVVTEVGGEVDEADEADEADEVEVEREVVERELEVEVEREVIEREVATVVAGVGVDADEVDVLGVSDTAAVAAAGQLPVTGPSTVPLLVLFGLLNLLFGVRLRRFGRGTAQGA